MSDDPEPIYIDEGRNADWINVVGRAKAFEQWSSALIDRECLPAYRAYADCVRARHIAYYEARPDERSPTHPFAAVSTVVAFPPGWAHLSSAVGAGDWHRHHRSGGSSQVLAIALLSAARRADPRLDWLPVNVDANPTTRFEVTLEPEVLNERPRQTSLDWLVTGDEGVVVGEAKFTEQGFGRCSCERRVVGRCSPRVLERPYWQVASRSLGLTRQAGRSCALSLAYQPVRNLAAAEAVAEGRPAAFVLLYDDRNPYFTGAGAWSGWVPALTELAGYSDVVFKALSWQQLLDRVPIDPEVVEWAAEKHGIHR